MMLQLDWVGERIFVLCIKKHSNLLHAHSGYVEGNTVV